MVLHDSCYRPIFVFVNPVCVISAKIAVIAPVVIGQHPRVTLWAGPDMDEPLAPTAGCRANVGVVLLRHDQDDIIVSRHVTARNSLLSPNRLARATWVTR